MCEICHTNPCNPRCPYAPEPPEIHHCTECDEGITDGEEFAEIDGEYYHLDCLAEKPIKELLELCGCDCKVAENEDPEYDF